MSRRLSLLGLLGAGLIVIGAATGCATGAASAPTSSASTADPDATTPAAATDVEAAWLNGGRSIALVTLGSSSCAPRITDEPTLAEGVLTVTLTDPAGVTCTRDMAPRATYVPLPAGTDSTQPLDISVNGAVTGTGTLSALTTAEPSADFAPSAGWVNDSLVAILTFGSSSCVPVVETVSAQGDALAVGFATPPADQVCTLDIAPQVSLADVTGIGGSDVTSLVLSGGGVTADGPVAVLGTR
ncbi:MAG: hypothetical protein K0S37_2625 [Microbacterium sp.]|jgi:hypothetical protein|nr:hypothetical protein [Microbacterium sp.]